MNIDDEDDEPDEWWLDCITDQPRPLVQLLTTTLLLSTKSSAAAAADIMTLFCGPTALTIHTHPSPQFQSTLELPRALFRRYLVAYNSNNNTTRNDGDHSNTHEQVSSFSVSTKTLLECLQVLSLESPQDLQWKYHGPSQVLRLEASLPKGGIASAALLAKIPPTESAELSAAFGAFEVVARLLCASQHLQDAAELDLVAGASTITLEFSQTSLTLTTVGHSSTCQVIVPGPMELTSTTGGDDAVAVIRYQYPLENWKRATKAMEVAKETCLSVNAQGILAVQHQILLTGQEEAAFCDCLLLPLIATEDEEESTSRTTATTHPLGDISLASRSRASSSYSQDWHSQPPHESTYSSQPQHPNDDTSTIATTTAGPPSSAPYPNHDEDDSDTDDQEEEPFHHLPAHKRPPPLTFGSTTGAGDAASLTSSASAAAPSSSRRFSSQYKRSRRRSSTSSSGGRASSKTMEEEEPAPEDDEEEQDHNHNISSQDPTPPSPSPRPHQPSEHEYSYCSSPEVVYGDTDL